MRTIIIALSVGELPPDLDIRLTAATNALAASCFPADHHIIADLIGCLEQQVEIKRRALAIQRRRDKGGGA